MNTKLNVLLAKTDHLAAPFKKMLEEYVKFFKGSGGSFTGEKKTYKPKDGMIDVPSERALRLVVTTVKEKLEYLEENSKDYVDCLFSQEKTNASGKATALLVVDGKTFGTFTSLELLKLKSFLEAGTLVNLYETLPVRTENEEWFPNSSEAYTGRDIYESKLQEGVRKSTLKEHFILNDPNLDKVKSDTHYTPQIAVKDTIIDLGDYTFQKFTGETSHRLRADILRRRSNLLTAVIEALKIANEAEAVASDMTSKKIFDYLHRGE